MKGETAEAVVQLRGTFEAARAFGLTDEQIWKCVVELSARTPPYAPAGEGVDSLCGELAREVIAQTA